MTTRKLLTLLISATAIGITGCHSAAAPSVSTTFAAPAAATTAIPAALTRQPCELLTPHVAQKYVGADARRQFAYDARPPVPVADTACYYTGATREIEVAIYPRPTDPSAPVNHFNVINPARRVDALSFEAYWFGPGESIVAVKDDLLITVKVANIKGSWTDQDRADDVDLAKLVVPRVG
jgi:hypothetical protein